MEAGGFAESLAIAALQRRDELRYMETTVLVNAILTTGHTVAEAISGSGGGGSDSIQKGLESLKKALLPHQTEGIDKKASEVKKILEKEASQGMLKYKVVGNDKKRSGQVRIRRKDH